MYVHRINFLNPSYVLQIKMLSPKGCHNQTCISSLTTLCHNRPHLLATPSPSRKSDHAPSIFYDHYKGLSFQERSREHVCRALMPIVFGQSRCVWVCLCFSEKRGEADRDEEKDRNKDPSVSTAHESLPFHSESQGTRARDNSLVAVFFVKKGVTPINNNNDT